MSRHGKKVIKSIYIQDFAAIRPAFEADQKQVVDWMMEAHVQAEASSRSLARSSPELELFRRKLAIDVAKVGCKSQDLAKRGFILNDFSHTRFEQMTIFPLNEKPEGVLLTERSKLYERVVDDHFDSFYADCELPDELIHVSCTGYVSPSAGQKLVGRRSSSCTVTHAYHMGCYGAFPALRMASGSLFGGKHHVDIVHTELCTLHFNPLRHSLEALVVQTLFADGFIRYRLSPKSQDALFALEAVHEEIIPGTSDLMRWSLSEAGFLFTLSKEIPTHLCQVVLGFASRLCKRASLDLNRIQEKLIFAIHPGGPRIIKEIQKIFQARDEQFEASYAVFRECGNMSSATVPHIWQEIAKDPKIPSESLVMALAFGPGLTIAGALLKKM